MIGLSKIEHPAIAKQTVCERTKVKRIKGSILAIIFLFLFWILFTYPLDVQEIFVGIIVVGVAVLASWRWIDVFAQIRITPKSLIYMVIYFFYFIKELLKANLDVAFRVIKPTLPINPGLVKVRTRLKSPLGRAVLANSITLTPGTLTVETKGEYFYIHWIDVQAENIEEATKSIVEGFEKYLEVIFA